MRDSLEPGRCIDSDHPARVEFAKQARDFVTLQGALRALRMTAFSAINPFDNQHQADGLSSSAGGARLAGRVLVRYRMARLGKAPAEGFSR